MVSLGPALRPERPGTHAECPHLCTDLFIHPFKELRLNADPVAEPGGGLGRRVYAHMYSVPPRAREQGEGCLNFCVPQRSEG